MASSLKAIAAQLPDVYKKSQFNRQDLVVILQGVTGFLGGVVGKDPFSMLSNAIGVAGHFATKCNTGSLHENLNKTAKWLAFGKEYAALEDSSDLDFDKMDIGSVPEVMKVITHLNCIFWQKCIEDFHNFGRGDSFFWMTGTLRIYLNIFLFI